MEFTAALLFGVFVLTSFGVAQENGELSTTREPTTHEKALHFGDDLIEFEEDVNGNDKYFTNEHNALKVVSKRQLAQKVEGHEVDFGVKHAIPNKLSLKSEQEGKGLKSDPARPETLKKHPKKQRSKKRKKKLYDWYRIIGMNEATKPVEETGGNVQVYELERPVVLPTDDQGIDVGSVDLGKIEFYKPSEILFLPEQTRKKSTLGRLDQKSSPKNTVTKLSTDSAATLETIDKGPNKIEEEAEDAPAFSENTVPPKNEKIRIEKIDASMTIQRKANKKVKEKEKLFKVSKDKKVSEKTASESFDEDRSKMVNSERVEATLTPTTSVEDDVSKDSFDSGIKNIDENGAEEVFESDEYEKSDRTEKKVEDELKTFIDKRVLTTPSHDYTAKPDVHSTTTDSLQLDSDEYLKSDLEERKTEDDLETYIKNHVETQVPKNIADKNIGDNSVEQTSAKIPEELAATRVATTVAGPIQTITSETDKMTTPANESENSTFHYELDLRGPTYELKKSFGEMRTPKGRRYRPRTRNWATLDQALLESELMSYKVDDNETEILRDVLSDPLQLEHDAGDAHRDFGSSFILPVLSAVNYDNCTVPLIFGDIPVNVRVQLAIIHLANFDSEQMEYTIDLEIEMRWFDLRLRSNYSKPVLLREKAVIDRIWRPDPYFVNSKYSYFHHVTFPNFRMRITPEGLVTYTMRATLLPSCQMVFCKYPHDRQSCDLLLSSIAYPRSFVNFSWHSTPIVFKSPIALPELHIKTIVTDTCEVENKLIHSSCLRLLFNLERDGGRFIVEKYVPSTLAMMFAWVAPYVPYNYEDVRIVTPIMVLLALVQMEKDDSAIRTSYLTSMNVWFGVMKAFSVLSLIESLVILAFIKRSRAMEKSASKAVTELEKDQFLVEKRRSLRHAHLLDRICRVLSPVTFIVFFNYYVLFVAQGDDNDCVRRQPYARAIAEAMFFRQ